MAEVAEATQVAPGAPGPGPGRILSLQQRRLARRSRTAGPGGPALEAARSKARRGEARRDCGTSGGAARIPCAHRPAPPQSRSSKGVPPPRHPPSFFTRSSWGVCLHACACMCVSLCACAFVHISERVFLLQKRGCKLQSPTIEWGEGCRHRWDYYLLLLGPRKGEQCGSSGRSRKLKKKLGGRGREVPQIGKSFPSIP